MFTDPEKNLKAFGLRDDMIVVDLGAGTGFYSMAAARMVPKGKVYSIDIIKDFLTTIKNKAKDAHLKNIECVWGNIEKMGGTGLGDGVADAVIASNVLFQVEDKDKFIREVKRILKPAGKMLLVDWSDSSIIRKHPGVHNISKHKISSLFKEDGFKLEKEIDAGESHYALVFKK